MALFHPDSGNLILHVVYDGIPRSGKTESVRSLGRLFDRPVRTFEERDGRTLFFDWLDYAGGTCLDRPIQCRVLSVPGQIELSRRRTRIVSAADVVVFVFDSSPEGVEASQRRFRTLQRQLKSRHRPIPVLVQANKQDLTGAEPPRSVQERLGVEPTPLATVATEDRGIREVFVLAVGAAVRSLREADLVFPHKHRDGTAESSLPGPDELLGILLDVDSH